MTEHASGERSWRSEQDPYTRRQSGWVGWVVFGAMMILFLGAWHVFLGVVSLWREEIFVTGRNEMPVDVSYTDWGWVHITVGVFALGEGFGVRQDSRHCRHAIGALRPAGIRTATIEPLTRLSLIR